MNQDYENMDWVTTLMGEKLLFGLLGKAIYAELDKTWLQSLIDEDVFTESPFGESQAEIQRGLEYLQSWSRKNRSGISEQAFQDIQVDYTRMFIGVGKVTVPMWESVYFNKERMIFQEETLQVRNWYRSFGLEAERLHQEPDDHIGLELIFLAHLAHLALQALDQKDETAFRHLLDMQREFFRKHPGTWVLKWCNLVKQHAKTDFYRGLASLTCGATLALSEILELKLLEGAAQ